MIKRIVKMEFQQDRVDDFLQLFEQRADRIRTFPGCHYLELLQVQSDPHVFFTLSIWDDTAALEAYRNSPLFAQTWSTTKTLFAKRPEAWTTTSIHRLPEKPTQ